MIIGPGGKAIPDPEERFRGLPMLVEYIDGRLWRLARDVAYRERSGIWTTIRKGFDFDWASVPWFLWPFCPPAGLHGQPYGLAAAWHDWLYLHQAMDGVPVSRQRADALFLEIMLYVGGDAWRARAMWAAVRVCGWWAWRRGMVSRGGAEGAEREMEQKAAKVAKGSEA
jgi:hypothetical protein